MFTRKKKTTTNPTSNSAQAPVETDVEVGPRQIRIGDSYAATWVVVGYPAEVGLGWLEPLLAYPGRVDVSLHVEPVAPKTASDQLRKQMARFEASSRKGAEQGRLEDFETETAAEDARGMAAALARGESKLYRVGLYLTVHAASQEELAEEVDHVQSLTSSMLIEARPASYRQLHGWVSCLPLGVDLLDQRRSMDTPAVSASYPFASPTWRWRPPPPPCSTGSTPIPAGSCCGTAGVWTPTTRWSWPGRGRARATSARPTCSGRCMPGSLPR